MENEKANLRRDDFKTGLLLILLSLSVLWEASSYPMTDSYGGVQNVWYVSPALFPLIIGLLLLILSLVLVGNAIAQVGWSNVWFIKRQKNRQKHRLDLRFFAIVLFFSLFVYAYIPYVDFFIASAFFLFVFISGYYLERRDILIINVLFYAVIAGALYIFININGEPAIHWITDGLTTFGLFSLFLINLNALGGEVFSRKKLRTALYVSILVPSVLCPIFRFGLLVPLPSEGIYIDLMEQTKYLLRSDS